MKNIQQATWDNTTEIKQKIKENNYLKDIMQLVKSEFMSSYLRELTNDKKNR